MPVPVARHEIQRGAVGARPQHVVHQADALEEVRPVERGQEPHAQNHVADGDVHRGLTLMLHPHHIVGAGALGRQPLVQPAERRGHRRILVAQPLDELHREGGVQRCPVERLERRCRGGRARAAEPEQLVGQRVGGLPGGPPEHDPLREPPEVFEEHHAQRDRHRPELADGQRLDALIGVHEPAQGLGVEPAVRVGHEGPGDAVDAGISGEGPFGELGQLAIEAGGQIVADLAELLVHDVEVVGQPLGRRGDHPLLADGERDDPIRLAQDAPVGLDARQQGEPAPRRPARDALSGREAVRVLLQALDTEELRPDRFLER